MAPPHQLVRCELPLWAVLGLNSFELVRRPTTTPLWEPPVHRSAHELAGCSCAVEAVALPAQESSPCVTDELELDEVLIGRFPGCRRGCCSVGRQRVGGEHGGFADAL